VAPFRHRIRVRYNECDQLDAVFNSNYLVYMDVTLTEMWREAFGSYTAMAESGVELVVAEANVRYHLPARFDDELEVAASIEKVGRTSLTTRFDVTRGDDVIAVGHLRHVFIEPGSGKTAIPDDIRGGLARYLDEHPSPSGPSEGSNGLG
jgi:acyl-CoA thioester hydrolase